MLTLLTFNVRLDVESDRPNHWQARRPLVEMLLQLYPADVLAFQEVMPNQHTDLVAMLPDFAWEGRGREPAGDGEGVYTFWNRRRLQVEKQETFYLSESPTRPGRAWDAGCPRIYNHVVLRDGERRFRVFNLHLDHVGVQARQRSAEIVRARLGESDLPAVVLGDFNVEQALVALPALAGLCDCNADHGADQEGTFHGFQGVPRRSPIDYVLTTPHFSVEFCQRVVDHWEGRFPSDHFGLLVQVEL